MTEMVVAEALTKTYRLGGAEVHALRGVDSPCTRANSWR